MFLFGHLLWQLHQNPAFLRAFITDAISTVYVYERLFYTLFTHVLLQVSGVLHALRTRQCVQWHADTHRAHLSPCQCFVHLTLLWLCTLALSSHSGPPTAAGPALPFALHSAYIAFTQGPPRLKLLLNTAVWMSAIFSCVGYKEWRVSCTRLYPRYTFLPHDLSSYYMIVRIPTIAPVTRD